jgi:hypothetical protein
MNFLKKRIIEKWYILLKICIYKTSKLIIIINQFYNINFSIHNINYNLFIHKHYKYNQFFKLIIHIYYKYFLIIILFI